MAANWAQLVFGAWLIASPWLLGFHNISLAKWNCLLLGLLLVLINAWMIFGEKQRVAQHDEEKK